MERGNRVRVARNLFARAAAAFLAWARNQSRVAGALAFVGDRVLAGELVLSTKLAVELCQRLRDFASIDIKSTTLDHRNVLDQLCGRSELALRCMQRTAWIT